MTWKKSGAIYDGDWKDDHRCGFGTYSVPEGAGYRKVYSGGWKNDKRHVCIHDFQPVQTTVFVVFRCTRDPASFVTTRIQNSQC